MSPTRHRQASPKEAPERWCRSPGCDQPPLYSQHWCVEHAGGKGELRPCAVDTCPNLARAANAIYCEDHKPGTHPGVGKRPPLSAWQPKGSVESPLPPPSIPDPDGVFAAAVALPCRHCDKPAGTPCYDLPVGVCRRRTDLAMGWAVTR